MDTTAIKATISELRRLYAHATDFIGKDTEADVARGRQIYHEIFAPHAVISAEGMDPVTGPDAWVEVVREALGPYEATQHLIGSQLVRVTSLPDDDEGGKAEMESYLQAWHIMPDGELWLYLGTYHDEVEHTAEGGWQIVRMHLAHTSSERRMTSR